MSIIKHHNTVSRMQCLTEIIISVSTLGFEITENTITPGIKLIYNVSIEDRKIEISN